jgi:hypothetical protein
VNSSRLGGSAVVGSVMFVVNDSGCGVVDVKSSRLDGS